ncbi:MAG: trigger factor, partial [Patescibacteria group bacterium]
MEQSETKKYTAKIKKLPRSQIEISAIIPAMEFDAVRSEAIRRIGADAELPGFRKGHVPESILVAKLGEGAILEEMAEISIGKAYPSVIVDNKLDVLGRPEVRITKIAMGNPLEFTLVTAVFPEINLPDYKKLAKKEARPKNEIVITDEEVEKALEQIRTMKTKSEVAPGGVATSVPPAPLDDAQVKMFGDFSGVEDLKLKLREGLAHEKERATKDKKRIAVIDVILADTKIELPEIILEQELSRMGDEFAQDVVRMGLTIDAYLKAVKKTKEELQKDWRPDAEKRAKAQLLVNRIAELEKLEPDGETLKREVAALRTRYPDAPEERAEGYVRMLLTNEKVFELLENPN